MKSLFVLLVIVSALLTACNWPAMLSIGADVIELRQAREANGQPHIEDVLKSDMER
jgi:predicted small secreted protein